MVILGLTFGHDAAASLIADGVVIADVAEERFTGLKHNAGFPSAAITYCLDEAGLTAEQVDVLAIAGLFLPGDLERYFRLSPEQKATLSALVPAKGRVRQMVVGSGQRDLPLDIPRVTLSPRCRVMCIEHHLGHAASAYFTRGRSDRCLVVTMDGNGDNVSVAVWIGEGNRIELVKKWGPEASLGFFYGNVTEALGWQHGDGEGITMGLAPYGEATKVGDRLDRFHPVFANGDLAVPHDFGPASYVIDHGSYHWHFAEAEDIRRVADACGPEHVAARAQEIIEQQVVPFIRHWTKELGIKRLACAGGLFLNIKLNQRLWHDGGLEEQWIFPNPGDSGLALGVALQAWHSLAQPSQFKRLESLYLGPAYGNDAIRATLASRHLTYREVVDPSLEAAKFLASGMIVGWFQGRMEAGPRALGNRSILMSANRPENKDLINARVKFRERFRPFCPSLLFDRKDDYLKDGREENFMITSFEVTDEKRDKIPAVVHVDGTLRPQTLKREVNPRFYDLIQHFGDLTGEYLVLNTSFNTRGKPIVCSPSDAIRCFFDSGLDALVIGNFALVKDAQGRQ